MRCPAPLNDPDCLIKNAIADAAMNSISCYDVDTDAETLGQPALHAGEIDQIELGQRIVIDNDVNVARRLSIAAGDGAENVQRRHAAGP